MGERERSFCHEETQEGKEPRCKNVML